MNTTIPAITDRLGRHWGQPPVNSILLDNTHAVMSKQSFSQLAEYSSTMPSGVYPGKMWSRHDGLFDRNCKPQDRRWLLCWFGEVPGNPTRCSINFRIILVVTP
jgi:hypothetical protein